MIYRLESGIDYQVKEKIITAALILATTVGVPALAAAINRLAPYEGFAPGQSVLGVNNEQSEEEDENTETNLATGGAQDSGQSDNASGSHSSTSPQKLELAPKPSPSSTGTHTLGGNCNCLTNTVEEQKDNVLTPPENAPAPIGGSSEPEANIQIEVEGVAGAEATLDIQDGSSVNLDL